MIWNTIVLAWRAIVRNLLRSLLTILGIVIGIAAVVTMVTLGNGATQSVSDQIRSMGTNLLVLMPGQRFGPVSAGASAFRIADVDAIRSQVPFTRAVAPIAGKAATAVFAERNWSTMVTGSNSDFFLAGNWTLSAGRTFTELEQRAGKAACVIGATVREKLFAKQDPIGSAIRVKGFNCEVIALLKAKGQSAMGTDQDDLIVMPLRTVHRRLTGNQDVGRILVSVDERASISKVQDQLTLLFRERRRVGESEEDDFRIMDTRQMAEMLTSTTRVLTMLLGAVAAVSLLVGGIGIMNIMLVSVTERTREIGIRLAIGALSREVLLQFLIEAVALSAVGGLIGLAVATGVSIFAANAMDVPYLFDPQINLVAFFFSTIVGVVFGFFPARQAARLDPIEALRRE